MTKRIPYQTRYQDLDRRPIRVEVRDEAGEIDWEQEPDDHAPAGTVARIGKPKLRDADTYDILRGACRTLQGIKALYRPDDERRVNGIYNQIEAAEERGQEDGAGPEARDVILGNQSYAWWHAMLLRDFPPGLNVDAAVAKERGDRPYPFRYALWGNAGFRLQNELRDPGDRDHEDLARLGLED